MLDGVNGVTLVAGRRNEADIESVLSAYGRAQMSADDIKGALDARQGKFVQAFAVFRKASIILQHSPENPTIATLRTVDNWNSAFLEWSARDQPQIGTLRGGIPDFPEFSAQTGTQANPPFSPIDALLTAALERFVFVAPFDFEDFFVL